MTTELHPMQLQQLDRIESVLKNMGCHYQIFLPNGQTRGELPAKQSKRAPKMFPHNEARTYYKPFVDDLKPGQVARIPLDKYPPDYLQGNVCAYLSTNWGKRTYTTAVNLDAHCLEVLRTEGL